MAKPAAKATVVVTGNTLHFNLPGTYTIEYLPSGNVQIKVNGGHAQVLKPAEYAAITDFTFAAGAQLSGPIQINGVTFHEADATGPFEISHNLNALIGSMFNANGVDYVLNNLIINGSVADTFKVVWDYLDDFYVNGIQYNEAFVRLGVAYVQYLENGGTPFTFVTAKFTADSLSDADLIPEREQSMHDNLLGNLTIGAINGRFAGDPVLKAELLALIPDEYEARLLYEGNDTQVGGARHDNVRAFDYDRSWDRPDYIDRDYNGLVDPLARDPASPGNVYNGTGQPADDWNIVRHEGAGVELALKVKHRQGDEYPEGAIDSNGMATYYVLTGPQPGNPTRAEWSFDFSATDFSPDDNFYYVVELDVDPGAGVQWQTIFTSAASGDSDLGSGATFQNSQNLAFFALAIDTDPDTAGIQPYAFGDGTFNVRITAFDAATMAYVARNEVQVIVGDGNPFG